MAKQFKQNLFDHAVLCFSIALNIYFYWLLIFMQRTAPNSLFSVSRMIFCAHCTFPFWTCIVLTIHKLVFFSSKHLFFFAAFAGIFVCHCRSLDPVSSTPSSTYHSGLASIVGREMQFMHCLRQLFLFESCFVMGKKLDVGRHSDL